MGDKYLRDLDYSEIIEIESQIPTLEQVLWSAKGKIGIEIELKELGYELEVVSIVQDYFNYDKFVLKSPLLFIISEIAFFMLRVFCIETF